MCWACVRTRGFLEGNFVPNRFTILVHIEQTTLVHIVALPWSTSGHIGPHLAPALLGSRQLGRVKSVDASVQDSHCIVCLYSHYAVTMQPLYSHYAVTIQPLCRHRAGRCVVCCRVCCRVLYVMRHLAMACWIPVSSVEVRASMFVSRIMNTVPGLPRLGLCVGAAVSPSLDGAGVVGVRVGRRVAAERAGCGVVGDSDDHSTCHYSI